MEAILLLGLDNLLGRKILFKAVKKQNVELFLGEDYDLVNMIESSTKTHKKIFGMQKEFILDVFMPKDANFQNKVNELTIDGNHFIYYPQVLSALTPALSKNDKKVMVPRRRESNKISPEQRVF